MTKYFDSPEAEKLRKLISNKETYLQTIAANKSKIAYQLTQKEIIFLKNDILPIVLNNSSVIYSEYAKYIVHSIDTAMKYKCNGILVYIPLIENYKDEPIVGIANSKQLQRYGTPGAMEIFVDNMDGNGAKVQPINLPLDTLLT